MKHERKFKPEDAHPNKRALKGISGGNGGKRKCKLSKTRFKTVSKTEMMVKAILPACIAVAFTAASPTALIEV
jgi:hypothetical protein